MNVIDDDILINIRKRLAVFKATNCLPQSRKTGSAIVPPSTPVSESSVDRGRSINIPSAIGRKRSFNSINGLLLLSKRTCSSSPTKKTTNPIQLNRVRRRVVLDYGKPVCNARSLVAMLAALKGFMEAQRGCAYFCPANQGRV
jgi:Fungal protein kinase